ncbi:hypothetical protein C8J56DRAFT_107200 [Mycena floridula]|nr:hypothetical protein C8J56DRAFT_107200 [Mycena floridula]
MEVVEAGLLQCIVQIPEMDHRNCDWNKVLEFVAMNTIHLPILRAVAKSLRHIHLLRPEGLSSPLPDHIAFWDHLERLTASRMACKARFEQQESKSLCSFSQCPANLLSYHDMRECSACRNAHYCSRECQKKDWKSHAVHCIQDIKKRQWGIYHGYPSPMETYHLQEILSDEIPLILADHWDTIEGLEQSIIEIDFRVLPPNSVILSLEQFPNKVIRESKMKFPYASVCDIFPVSDTPSRSDYGEPKENPIDHLLAKLEFIW